MQLGGETLPAFGERHVFAGLESIPEAPGVTLPQRRADHPRRGRLVSPDPVELAGGMLRTRCAEADGVTLLDPMWWSTTGLNDPATTEGAADAR